MPGMVPQYTKIQRLAWCHSTQGHNALCGATVHKDTVPGMVPQYTRTQCLAWCHSTQGHSAWHGASTKGHSAWRGASTQGIEGHSAWHGASTQGHSAWHGGTVHQDPVGQLHTWGPIQLRKDWLSKSSYQHRFIQRTSTVWF